MFANPLWSLALIASLILVYIFLVRPRLKVALSETYSHLDSFWARLWARLYAFRTPVVAALGVLGTALPDLLVLIPTLDLSFLPQPWPAWSLGASSFATIIMKAMETKPRDEAA